LKLVRGYFLRKSDRINFRVNVKEFLLLIAPKKRPNIFNVLEFCSVYLEETHMLKQQRCSTEILNRAPDLTLFCGSLILRHPRLFTATSPAL